MISLDCGDLLGNKNNSSIGFDSAVPGNPVLQPQQQDGIIYTIRYVGLIARVGLDITLE